MTEPLLPEQLRSVNLERPGRPTRNNELVLQAAVRSLADELRQWLQGKGEKDTTLEDLLEDARELLYAIASGSNGYELARELEDKHWSPDRDLVELLEDTDCLDDAYDAAVKKWITDWEILPSCPLGAVVKFRHNSKDYTGEIVQIDADRAKYVVFCEALGHERDDQPMKPGKAMRTTGLYMDYDEVKSCE